MGWSLCRGLRQQKEGDTKKNPVCVPASLPPLGPKPLNKNARLCSGADSNLGRHALPANVMTIYTIAVSLHDCRLPCYILQLYKLTKP